MQQFSPQSAPQSPPGFSQTQGFTQPSGFHLAHFTQPQSYAAYLGGPNMMPSVPVSPHYSTQSTGSAGNCYFDSGATSHVTSDLSNLTIQQPYTGGDGVLVGSGSTVPIAHSGKCILITNSYFFLFIV